jgi:hypothetical protein
MRAMPTFARQTVVVTLVGMVAFAGAGTAAAQSGSVPDFAQFGFPRVTATVEFTPGQATTVQAGPQQVDIPADFLDVPARFEFLEGDAAAFAPVSDGRAVVATFAFRVTNLQTGELVARFNKPVQWRITDGAIRAESAVFDTSPSTPPVVTPNSVSPGTVTGQTLAHPFIISTVGWLVLNPATAPAPTTLPRTGGGLFDGVATPLVLLGVGLVLGGIGWVWFSARRRSVQ